MYFLKDSTKSDEYYLVNFFPHYCVVFLKEQKFRPVVGDSMKIKKLNFYCISLILDLEEPKKLFCIQCGFLLSSFSGVLGSFLGKNLLELYIVEEHMRGTQFLCVNGKLVQPYRSRRVTKLLFYIYYFSRQKYEIFIFRF